MALPPEAALWRMHEYPMTPKQKAERKYTDAKVVSIDEFVARNRSNIA